MHKTGTLGLMGPKVDSITYWTDKIRELTPLLEEERKRVQADAKEDAALVFFNDRRAAAEAAQVYFRLWTPITLKVYFFTKSKFCES